MVGEPEQLLLMEAGGIKLDNMQRVVCESEWCVRGVHASDDFPPPTGEERDKRYQKCVFTLMNHVRPGSL